MSHAFYEAGVVTATPHAFCELILADSDALSVWIRERRPSYVAVCDISFDLDGDSCGVLDAVLPLISTGNNPARYAWLILATRDPNRTLQPVLERIKNTRKALLGEHRVFRLIVPGDQRPADIDRELFGAYEPVSPP